MSATEIPEALQGVFFLAGPTAVGKTDAALAVAEACGGEIVGADAFQVYRGLDILTAKPSAEALARVPHHLVGTVPLEEPFDVARWREAALAAIAAIRARGRLPIVAGGTGLYFRALTRGLADLPPASPELRAELNALPLEEALERLERLDPEGAARVDRRNPRRVVRALEICLATGRPFSSFRREWETAPPFHGVLLERSPGELAERIARRTEAMFAQGVVEEVRAVAGTGTIGPTALQVLGWREITALLRGECTREEAVGAIAQATRRYAKRQRTWFRAEPMFAPVSLSGNAGALEAIIARAEAARR